MKKQWSCSSVAIAFLFLSLVLSSCTQWRPYQEQQSRLPAEEQTEAQAEAEVDRQVIVVVEEEPAVAHYDFELVVQVQEALYDQGYLDKEDIDGLYSHSTAQAIRAFQMDEGLSVTGYLNKETLTSLRVADYIIEENAHAID